MDRDDSVTTSGAGAAIVRRSKPPSRLCVKTTEYFTDIRKRSDRARIRDEWIDDAIRRPVAEQIQDDGRIRRWTFVVSERRFLRVILLGDGETVHNAFFDRGYRP